MTDQADKLRHLATYGVSRAGAALRLPPTIVVTGSKGGVGTTTVAVNLAAALSRCGRRTVLVDTAPRADTAHWLGIDAELGQGLADVLSGVADVADALHHAAAGILLLAPRWSAERAPDRSVRSFDRLLAQLQTLEGRADAIVVDSGSGATDWTERWWKAADLVLLVTTQDDVAVMNAYVTVKQCGVGDAGIDVRVLVNQCDNTASSIEVQSRLAATGRRFLGFSIGRAPRLARHDASIHAIGGAPLGWEMPATPFGRSVAQLGRFADDVLSNLAHADIAEEELCRC